MNRKNIFLKIKLNSELYYYVLFKNFISQLICFQAVVHPFFTKFSDLLITIFELSIDISAISINLIPNANTSFLGN